ncbi:MAG: Pr6Pr family membrane protein [Bifidobacterium crudilactis]|jgi:hypothetical protein|nr:Pr6Pr family membrane protein [Bifidobacterium crudilactis]
MRFLAALYRFVIAFFCFAGTYEAWLSGIGNRWVFFTVQTNVLLGVVMLWAGAATLLKGIQPPAWIKGALTLNIIVTGLVAWFVLPPSDPATTAFAFGVMTTTMAHIIVPIMASVDFLVFDPHRRFPWHYTLSWLIYFPFYLAFVLIRAQIWPHSGPGASGNPYPIRIHRPSGPGMAEDRSELRGISRRVLRACAGAFPHRPHPAETHSADGPVRPQRMHRRRLLQLVLRGRCARL